MVSNEGDILEPKVLIVNTEDNTNEGKEGEIKISGSKLHVYVGGWEKVTSA